MTDGQLRLDYEAARVSRDEGMARVDLHADADWKQAAAAIIESLPPGSEFMAEQVRVWVETLGYSTHDCRALGPVIMAAKRDGLIVAVGARPAKTSRLGLKTVWMRR